MIFYKPYPFREMWYNDLKIPKWISRIKLSAWFPTHCSMFFSFYSRPRSRMWVALCFYFGKPNASLIKSHLISIPEKQVSIFIVWSPKNIESVRNPDVILKSEGRKQLYVMLLVEMSTSSFKIGHWTTKFSNFYNPNSDHYDK